MIVPDRLRMRGGQDRRWPNRWVNGRAIPPRYWGIIEHLMWTIPDWVKERL